MKKFIKKYLIKKIKKNIKKYNYLLKKIQDKNIFNNLKKYKKICKNIFKIRPIIKYYNLYKKEINKIKENKKFINDKEFKNIALDEIKKCKDKIFFLNKKIEKNIIINKNINNKILLEIRAASGGEEAALFVKDLYKMYFNFSQKNN